MLTKQQEKQINQLLGYFQDFDLTDILGFGQILGVEESEDFVEYCTDITTAFCNEGRLRRKQLIKLAKDIAVSNKFSVAPAQTPGDTQEE